MTKCSVTLGSGGIVFKTPYDAALVADLKARIPATDRKFDPAIKAWVVALSHGPTLQNLAQMYFGEVLPLPQVSTVMRQVTRLLEVQYIGQCKQREDGQSTAFGWCDGEWSVIFPEQVLRQWFETGPAPVQAPDRANTLYEVLGISRTASEEDIKTAFRKTARQWHPDVCKEPNAHEMFIRVKEASDILTDPHKRSRYDVGLSFSSRLETKERLYTDAYRSPLRAGWIMCSGTNNIGRFVVDNILSWEEIVDPQGRILVSSWPMGAKQPFLSWV